MQNEPLRGDFTMDFKVNLDEKSSEAMAAFVRKYDGNILGRIASIIEGQKPPFLAVARNETGGLLVARAISAEEACEMFVELFDMVPALWSAANTAGRLLSTQGRTEAIKTIRKSFEASRKGGKAMKFVLFHGRHKHRETEGLPAIFEEEVNPVDFGGMKRTAFMRLANAAPFMHEVDLYCTGLTAAVCAVIEACIEGGMPLTLWHYDKESDTYRPQHITTSVI